MRKDSRTVQRLQSAIMHSTTESHEFAGTDHFRMVVESANQGIWFLDAEGKTLYANPTMAQMIDHTAGEVQKRTLFDFCFPEDITFAKERISRSLQGHAEKFDCRLRTTDGKLVWALACTNPMRNETDDVVGVVCFFTDITNRRITEIALRESEKRFRVMADTAPIMMWISGKDMQYIYFNKLWLNFTGRTFIQELGVGWREGIHPDDAAASLQVYSAAFKKQEPFEIEYRLRRKDGTYRWVLDRGAPRFTTEGEFLGYIGSCMDISERKENENQLTQLATIIESADDAIYSIDLDGTVRTWNKAAEKIFGYEASEMIGQKIDGTTVPQFKHDELQDIYAQLKKGTAINSFETIRQRKDGTLIEALITLSKLKDESGKIIGSSVIAQDITDKKSAERERDELLIQLNELISIAPIGIAFINKDLEYIKVNKMLTRINGKTVTAHLNKKPSQVLSKPLAKIVMRQLKKVLDTKQVVTVEYQDPSKDTDRTDRWWGSTYYPIKLSNGEYAIGALVQDITEQKLTDRRKDDFISMASHELKTPVTTIKAFTQILQHIPNLDSEKSKDYLQKISSEVNRLTKLINDFLDVSKIRTGRLQIIKEPFKFDELVQEIVQSYKTLNPDFTFKITGSTDKTVIADRSRIGQVIRNLIDNALKYSPKIKQITVALSANDSEVTFKVKDKGIGISKDNQAKIFESFYRAFESEKVDYPGLGIGLYITAEIIKSHKGTITVDSKKGSGSTFICTVPLK